MIKMILEAMKGKRIIAIIGLLLIASLSILAVTLTDRDDEVRPYQEMK